MNYFQNLSLIVAVAVVAFLVVVLVFGGWLVGLWLDEKAGLRLKGPVQNVRIK